MLFLRQPGFGRLPSGERLERIKQSPHYHDGAFRNLQPTELMTSEKGRLRVMWDFLFNKPEIARQFGLDGLVRTFVLPAPTLRKTYSR